MYRIAPRIFVVRDVERDLCGAIACRGFVFDNFPFSYQKMVKKMMFTVYLLHEYQIRYTAYDSEKPIYWISSPPIRFCVSSSDLVGDLLYHIQDGLPRDKSEIMIFLQGEHVTLEKNLSWEDQGIFQTVDVVLYNPEIIQEIKSSMING